MKVDLTEIQEILNNTLDLGLEITYSSLGIFFDEPYPRCTLTMYLNHLYEDVLVIPRALHIQKWEKFPYVSGDTASTTIEFKYNSIKIRVVANSLPPTCRLVKTIKFLPKTEVKEVGEFIEVEETKVVCDE